jgi:hypothetical protein
VYEFPQLGGHGLNLAMAGPLIRRFLLLRIKHGWDSHGVLLSAKTHTFVYIPPLFQSKIPKRGLKKKFFFFFFFHGFKQRSPWAFQIFRQN